MRLRPFALPTLLLSSLVVAGAAHAAPEIACVANVVNPERIDLRCPLASAGAARSFRFQANFVGGHDDTRASLTASVDGAPDACGEGSKTSLFGEDGEIHLLCRVDRPGRELAVTVVVSHAQYVGYAFVAE